MPYDLRDLEGTLYLTDSVRDSMALICTVDGICIPAHGSVPLLIESEIPALTTALIIRDLAMVDGVPLHFEIALSCSYLLGMADFRVNADIEVPITAPGEKMSYRIIEDTEGSFGLSIEGLAEWLLPDDGSLLMTDGMNDVHTSWYTADRILSITISANDLNAALRGISKSESAVVMDDSGSTYQICGEDAGSLIDLLERLGRVA